MVESRTITARDRLIAEAARLFARNGYAATSVADIQMASGLTGGSGALYKHFRSKRELLAAVIDTHITTMRVSSQWFTDDVPDDLIEALRATAHAVWKAMQRDRQALRVMLRDLDEFPDLLETVWTEVREQVYDTFTGWLDDQAQRGAVRSIDPAATAAVLLASLTYYPILDTLIGHHPGDIEAERFMEAWVHHALATLRPPDPT